MRPTKRAQEAACAVALAHGVEIDRCEVLQDGSTLVLRLSETLVARVVQDVDGPRQGGEWFARENAVAIYLAKQGAPVIPMHLDIPPGPHEWDGFPMNFWRYVSRTEQEPDPEQAGARLFLCQRILTDFEGDLPRLGILRETRALLERESAGFAERDREMLCGEIERGLEAFGQGTLQPLHGDAHPGNLLATDSGILWTDWEDCFLGPVEWDLSSLLWNAKHLEGNGLWVEKVLSGYRRAGGKWDDRLLDICDRVRAAVMTAWYPFLYPNCDGERRRKLEFRLEWLRARL